MQVTRSQNQIRQTTEREPLSLLRVPKPIDIVQLQTTATTIFTAEDTADFQIENLVATNVTATDDYLTLYLVPAAGSAGAATTIVYQRVVPGKSGLTVFDKNNLGFMQPGMTLQALCGVNDAVNIWGYGFDYQGQYSV